MARTLTGLHASAACHRAWTAPLQKTSARGIGADGGDIARNRFLAFNNSNGLVRAGHWDIGLSKTGYISEAGRCLVMQARIAAKPVIIVLLDSWGKFSRMADANRIKSWIEMEMGVREPPRIRTVAVRHAPRHSVRATKVIRVRAEGRRARAHTRRM